MSLQSPPHSIHPHAPYIPLHSLNQLKTLACILLSTHHFLMGAFPNVASSTNNNIAPMRLDSCSITKGYYSKSIIVGVVVWNQWCHPSWLTLIKLSCALQPSTLNFLPHTKAEVCMLWEFKRLVIWLLHNPIEVHKQKSIHVCLLCGIFIIIHFVCKSCHLCKLHEHNGYTCIPIV